MWCVKVHPDGRFISAKRIELVDGVIAHTLLVTNLAAWHAIDRPAAEQFDPHHATQRRFMQATGLDNRDDTTARIAGYFAAR